MKATLTVFSFFFLANGFAQDIKYIEKQLSSAFHKIAYWRFNAPDNSAMSAYDSVEKANAQFSKLLLQYTSSHPQTISCDFKRLRDSGLIISTSRDGRFRIYSWNTWTGGTMHRFANIFQHQSNGKVFSRKSDNNNDETDNPDCVYTQVNDIVKDNQTFYVTQSRFILSSALSYHNVKVFSIDNSKLNDKARLIKTQTGIKNELGYEVDLSAFANRGRKNLPDYYITYDTTKKIISIPLIAGDSKVTGKRIRYQFTGQYFEKMP